MDMPPSNGHGTSDPVLLGARAELARLTEENKANMRTLPVPFDGLSLVHSRIDSLVDTLAEGMGPEEGPRFAVFARLRFQQLLAQQIEAGQSAGRRALIAQGGTFTAEAIRQMAKETGLFDPPHP